MRLVNNGGMDALDRLATDYDISEVGDQTMGRDARSLFGAMERWVQEIGKAVEEQVEVDEEEELSAWDDVRGGRLNVKDVTAARKEEVGYMKKRGIWVERSVEECWQWTGKAAISVK